MEELEMTTTVCRMLVLSMVATIALAVDNRAQLAAQEYSRGRFRAEAAEALPPPERPETERPETERREVSTRRPQSVNAGRPYLGITFDPQYAGAVVASAVVPGGPADQAGIQPGDTIEAINDRRVSSYRDAAAIVDVLRPGEIVDIDYSRRVSGRTQAVLGGDPTQEARATNFSNEDLDGAYPERPAAFQIEDLPVRPAQERSLLDEPREERLPEPTDYREFPRSNRAQLSATPSEPGLYYNGAGADPRDSLERRRTTERRQPAERGFRGRPLLPWRRN
jgi:membrane-associated protease RseP (regulator of RpoE activity)